MVGYHHIGRPAVPFKIQQFSETGVLDKPVGHAFDGQRGQMGDKPLRLHTGFGFKIANVLIIHVPSFAAEFYDKLIFRRPDRFVIF